ncbi:MAG: HAD-IC family P-type ATPase [Gammaproteobacteria bacterium]|jgi:Ca2+-transporting ATPase
MTEQQRLTTEASRPSASPHEKQEPLLSLKHNGAPGRARFRSPVLYRAEQLAEIFETRLKSHQAIRDTRINTLTGSVLVWFDPAVDTADGLMSLMRIELLQVLRLPIDRAAKTQHSKRPAASVTLISEYAKAKPPVKTPSLTRPLSGLWHTKPAAAVLRELGGVDTAGLSSEEAAARLGRFGPNRLSVMAARSRLELFASQFVSLPVALLGASAAVAVVTGGLLDAVAIAAVVLINAGIGYYTEEYAERTIRALTRPPPGQAVVLRDGKSVKLRRAGVVPGDILVLNPGQQVPADARVVRSEQLSVDESALTGESLPVSKASAFTAAEETPLADRRNMVYMDTFVTGGSGQAVVVATGAQTEIGRIQTMVGETRPPETPMQRQLGRMGTQLALLSAAVCGGVFVVGLVRGYGWVEMLKSSISLAVAAVPEGLPAVATTTLALGMQNMRRRKVLARRLDAVETLGSVQVICLDKTGTLTRNRMSVVSLHTHERDIVLNDGQFLSGGEAVAPTGLEGLMRLLQVTVLCNESEPVGPPGNGEYRGSPTESALLEAASQAGIDIAALRDQYPLESVQYRSEQANYMATFHTAADGGRFIAVKGRPDQVLSLCTRHMHDGALEPLSEDARYAIMQHNDQMAGDALRVLGVAFAQPSAGQRGAVEDLVWLGLVGMADPLRTGMQDLIALFHRAGIDTVMITGDQSATAYAIGRQLRLANDQPLQILESTRLENMDETLLAGMVQRVHVFSRVSPAHKLKIVQALQRAGRVVAMTGDGINDSPALRAADIGVALGTAGSEAARNTADIVLEDDNLHTMVIAVEQGRTIYANIRKSIHFLLATNFSEIEVMLASIALGLGQPLNAMQLLWINLITDVFPALALAMEPSEADALDRRPRDPEEPIIRRQDLVQTGVESAVISGGALTSYGYALLRYGPGPTAGTHAFTTLTLGQLLHTYSCRSENRTLFTPGRRPSNPYLNWALGGSLAAQLVAAFTPGLRKLLGTTPLGALDALVIAAGAGAPFIINELNKTLKSRDRPRPAAPQTSHKLTPGEPAA